MNKYTRVWSLQDAKAKFSEVVRLAQTEGPQMVTVHGREAVTITKSEKPALDVSKLTGAEFLKLLQAGPAIDFEMPPRPTGDGSRKFSFE